MSGYKVARYNLRRCTRDQLQFQDRGSQIMRQVIKNFELLSVFCKINRRNLPKPVACSR